MTLDPFTGYRRGVTPDGVTLYAVGDVHGRSDLLRLILSAIADDLAAEGGVPGRIIVVGLGDYIDQGPDSRGVLDILIKLQDTPRLETCFLRGNHEQALLEFLNDARRGSVWYDNGGGHTLTSYGVATPDNPYDVYDWERARRELIAAMPPRHIALLNHTAASLGAGGYFFAHAGARPNVPLNRQQVEDLMWIREPFLSHSKPFEQVVVHGHAHNFHSDERRLCLDTRPWETGILTAARLRGSDRWLLQTRPEPGGGFTVARNRLRA